MIHGEAGARGLGLVRIVVFGLWGIHLAIVPLHLYAEYPRTIFAPPGFLAVVPMEAWDLVLDPTVLTVFRLGLLGLVALAILGARPWTPLALLTWIGLLVFDGIVKSFSAWINHGQFGILYGALILALFPAADGMSAFAHASPSRENEPRGSAALYRVPILASAFLLAMTYSFTGLERFLRGGFAIFVGDALPHYLALRTFESGQANFQFGLSLPTLTAFAVMVRTGFFLTTLAEVFSPFALVRRRVRWIWLGVIVPFHLATAVLMNIVFWENLVLILVLLTDLPSRMDRVPGRAAPGG